MFAVVVTQSHWNPFGFSVRILFVSYFFIVLCYCVPCVLGNYEGAVWVQKYPKSFVFFWNIQLDWLRGLCLQLLWNNNHGKGICADCFKKNNTVLLFFATSKRHSDRTFGESHGLGCFTYNTPFYGREQWPQMFWFWSISQLIHIQLQAIPVHTERHGLRTELCHLQKVEKKFWGFQPGYSPLHHLCSILTSNL